MKRFICILSCFVFVVLCTGVAAHAALDDFYCTVTGYDNVSGGGTGYDGGTWFEYPQGTEESWWNQWFYNGPIVLPGGIWGEFSFDYAPIDPEQESYLNITMNWTTPDWSPNPAAPPLPGLPPNAEDYIDGRQGYWGVSGESTFDTGLWIPTGYSPEWMSISVRGYNMEITDGTFEHVGVPIPAAVWLLGSGLIGLVGIRRRYKK